MSRSRTDLSFVSSGPVTPHRQALVSAVCRFGKGAARRSGHPLPPCRLPSCRWDDGAAAIAERTIAPPPSGWQRLETGGCRITQGKPVERMWTRRPEVHFKGLSLGHESRVKGRGRHIPSARCASRICFAQQAVPFRENSHNLKACGQGIEKHAGFVTGENRGIGDAACGGMQSTVADVLSGALPAIARRGAGSRR